MPSFEKPITPSFDKQPKDDEPFIYAEALYTLMDFGFPENDIKLVLRALKGNLQLASAVLPLTEQMRAFYEKSVQQMELENTGTMGGGDLQLSQHSEPELAGGLHPMDTSSESDNVVVTLLQNAIQSMNKKAGMDKPKTPEEKLKDIEDIEKMVNDPDQCRRITKLIKWVVVDSSKALKAFPDFIKVAFNKISKRKKAEAILTKEQRACIKQVLISTACSCGRRDIRARRCRRYCRWWTGTCKKRRDCWRKTTESRKSRCCRLCGTCWPSAQHWALATLCSPRSLAQVQIWNQETIRMGLEAAASDRTKVRIHYSTFPHCCNESAA
eukprot:TRINITY_DN12405_c0_g1_i8.p1 TRINITY_DN12405_c0_g1~~TRINITY_DN12405_c0_g1_i8.p1  ORF type:complete len:326 (-),score=34.72 TRINITY_DN12405_c0_g1_i8:880-1857(-)